MKKKKKWSNEFELDNIRGYCYCTNPNDSDSSGYESEYCKCEEKVSIKKPRIIYENNNWLKPQFKDKYGKIIDDLPDYFFYYKKVKIIKITKEEYFTPR